MIHLYCGDGKGKTTAAAGLAARAAGSGMKVLFCQFFKDGSSSELESLRRLGIETRNPSAVFGLYKYMTEEQRKETREAHNELLYGVIADAGRYDLIVLDEAVSTYRYQMLDREKLISLLKTEGQSREIVLTGRKPADELVEAADYVTEMKKIKHPFDGGLTARKGIEY